jgi:hypothetical protein
MNEIQKMILHLELLNQEYTHLLLKKVLIWNYVYRGSKQDRQEIEAEMAKNRHQYTKIREKLFRDGGIE